MITDLNILDVNNESIEKNVQYLFRARDLVEETAHALPEILFITSYPPRECGIATYSQDLVSALNYKFNRSFNIRICALETNSERFVYAEEVKYKLNTDSEESFIKLADTINTSPDICLVMIQHEFGLYKTVTTAFQQLLETINKPIITVFHTVLPAPNKIVKESVQQIADISAAVIVMTNTSAKILTDDYEIKKEKLTIIPHGTHLVQHLDKEMLKKKYHLSGRKILSTFGLLSSGKSIETTIQALPAIISAEPDVLFLIIGKTHPSVVKSEGETYRRMLEATVFELNIQEHVRFINHFLPLPELLEYLQLTDIYLFTSKDPNQAVSGTFSYAISCGCPVISTPIPHAREVLLNDSGIIVAFENTKQIGEAVTGLLMDENHRKNISLNGLHSMASTAWENSAISHLKLFDQLSQHKLLVEYNIPPVNLDHIKKLTTRFGMIQFSKINQPDIHSGYTLDDNARALIAICQHYELTSDSHDLAYIDIYLNFIKFCQLPDGRFLNYVNELKEFTEQNKETNLEDANGRAIWAIGYLISIDSLLPHSYTEKATSILFSALLNTNGMHSTRAMAFIIKGLYYCNTSKPSTLNTYLIRKLANRLVQMYRHEADNTWQWFEAYLTYANSLLPEAMLCAWLATGEPVYKEIAKTAFDFLLSKTFIRNHIKVISNKNWLSKGKEPTEPVIGGEQPIDVAYTIIALGKFYQVYKNEDYLLKMKNGFNWFLGDNHLQQVIYNPCTGGCYDGLEEKSVNLNQGAESTVSYLMAKLTVEKIQMDMPVIHVLGNIIAIPESKSQPG